MVGSSFQGGFWRVPDVTGEAAPVIFCFFVFGFSEVTIVKLMPTILKYLLSAEKTRSMKFEKLKWVRSGG